MYQIYVSIFDADYWATGIFHAVSSMFRCSRSIGRGNFFSLPPSTTQTIARCKSAPVAAAIQYIPRTAIGQAAVINRTRQTPAQLWHTSSYRRQQRRRNVCVYIMCASPPCLDTAHEIEMSTAADILLLHIWKQTLMTRCTCNTT